MIRDMNIKEFYCEAFPTDELGVGINPRANFESLWIVIRGGLFYEYIGVFDSIIRERIFEKFSELTGHDYETIYQEWLNA